MELLDFSELPAALLAVHSLLQPLVSLHQEQNGEKRWYSAEFTLLCLTYQGENYTEADFQ